MRTAIGLLFLIFLVLAATAAPCPAASFDCAKAQTYSEKTVCEVETLSKLDDRLARAFAKALKAASNRPGLRARQMDWLTKEREACRDAACIEAAYVRRIEELDMIAAAPAPEQPPAKSTEPPMAPPAEAPKAVPAAPPLAEPPTAAPKETPPLAKAAEPPLAKPAEPPLAKPAEPPLAKPAEPPLATPPPAPTKTAPPAPAAEPPLAPAPAPAPKLAEPAPETPASSAGAPKFLRTDEQLTQLLDIPNQAAPAPNPANTERAKWMEKLHWPTECEMEFQGIPHSPAVGSGLVFHKLKNGKLLVEVYCSSGAYQNNESFVLFDQASGEAATQRLKTFEPQADGTAIVREEIKLGVLATFGGKDNTLSILSKPQAAGDCGSFVTYSFEKAAPTVLEARAQACTTAKTAGLSDPKKWPKIKKP